MLLYMLNTFAVPSDLIPNGCNFSPLYQLNDNISSSGSRPSSVSVLGRVAEFQNVMADLYLQQAEVSKYWALIGPDIKWLYNTCF